MRNDLDLFGRALLGTMFLMVMTILTGQMMIWRFYGPDVVVIPDDTPQVTADQRPAVDVSRNLAGEGCVYAVTVDGDVYQADGPCPVNR